MVLKYTVCTCLTVCVRACARLRVYVCVHVCVRWGAFMCMRVTYITASHMLGFSPDVNVATSAIVCLPIIKKALFKTATVSTSQHSIRSNFM